MHSTKNTLNKDEIIAAIKSGKSKKQIFAAFPLLRYDPHLFMQLQVQVMGESVGKSVDKSVRHKHSDRDNDTSDIMDNYKPNVSSSFSLRAEALAADSVAPSTNISLCGTVASSSSYPVIDTELLFNRAINTKNPFDDNFVSNYLPPEYDIYQVLTLYPWLHYSSSYNLYFFMHCDKLYTSFPINQHAFLLQYAKECKDSCIYRSFFGCDLKCFKMKGLDDFPFIERAGLFIIFKPSTLPLDAIHSKIESLYSDFYIEQKRLALLPTLRLIEDEYLITELAGIDFSPLGSSAYDTLRLRYRPIIEQVETATEDARRLRVAFSPLALVDKITVGGNGFISMLSCYWGGCLYELKMKSLVNHGKRPRSLVLCEGQYEYQSGYYLYYDAAFADNPDIVDPYEVLYASPYYVPAFTYNGGKEPLRIYIKQSHALLV